MAENPVTTAKPLAVLTGRDSQVRKPSYYRISSSEQWDKVWSAHHGKTQSPTMEIDFEKCMVIAVFQGTGRYSDGLEIDSISETADRITLRFRDRWYAIALRPGQAPPDDAPYGFIILPTSKKPVFLEEQTSPTFDKTTGKRLPPDWKERARLEPTGDSSRP